MGIRSTASRRIERDYACFGIERGDLSYKEEPTATVPGKGKSSFEERNDLGVGKGSGKHCVYSICPCLFLLAHFGWRINDNKQILKLFFGPKTSDQIPMFSLDEIEFEHQNFVLPVNQLPEQTFSLLKIGNLSAMIFT